MINHPINFVCVLPPPLGLLSNYELEKLNESEIRKYVITADDCWIFLSWFNFRKAGLNATLSGRARLDSINVRTAIDRSVPFETWPAFTVVCRADGPDSRLANFVIDQNALRQRENVGWVHHWIQPELIPRDRTRNGLLRNATFKGFSASLDRTIVNDAVISQLREIGVTFRIDDFDSDGYSIWHDYSDTDVVIAIRNLTKYSINNKPASKLINAWHAGVPAILGPEPAYRSLRQSQFDYIEASSSDDIVAAVKGLLEDRSAFDLMVQTCRERSSQLNNVFILKQWVDQINDVIGPQFDRFLCSPGLTKLSRAACSYPADKVIRRLHASRIRSGALLLD